MELKKIIKRNGKIVDFDIAKISRAIFKAAQSIGGKDFNLAKEIAKKVLFYAKISLNTDTPTVEQIQDCVEKVLIEEGHAQTAKAYILYRNQRKQTREMQGIINSTDMVDNYLKKMDWMVKENSNMDFSLQGLNNYLSNIVISKYWLNKIYPKEVREAHTRGDLHIHDLGMLSAYCCGWELKDLLESGFGGVYGKVESRPPKHLKTALGQIVNFFYTLQGETAGAVAFSNFDTYLSPFIRYDNLDYKEVKQAIQEFIFNINVPTRVGFQCISQDTQILTHDGWKNYDEINIGDKIKTFNISKKIIEDNVVNNVFKKKYKGIMYNLKNQIQDQLISPEHRVVRKKFQSNEYVLEPIEEVIKLKSPVIIPISENKETCIQKINKINYNGIIWCPNTKNETVIARRNGKVFITGNTPFTNITMDLVPTGLVAKENIIIGGKKQKETYAEFQKEMDILNKAFAEVMCEGDARGRIFTFPIPTYNITKKFNWDNKNLDSLWEMTSKYGTPYFSNFIHSDMNPDDVRSMCCRLKLDNRELRKRQGGLFASAPLTGSIAVVTINLPRIGFVSHNKAEFYEQLEYLMRIAKTSLEIKRKILEEYTKGGLYPYAKFYLRKIYNSTGKYWSNHFNTIGFLGMNEAILNFLGEDIGTKNGKKFALEIMDFMRKKLSDFQKDSGNMYNLEATPAEGCNYRFAKLDKQQFINIIQQGKNEPYYTNSSQLPVDYTEDMFFALEHQDELQCKYSGGTVLHIFLGEHINDKNMCKKLVKKIAYNFKLPYFSITPTFSICPVHGYIPGEHWKCPVCIKEEKNECRWSK
ncbi:MAG: hypothetical protein B6U87_00520 [Candidatus Aenigmarchaeota archaeon ex4484_52]|nr:MAG: hypothetical protein B6U87_00520 [Candidatus Aenigmarchaeota archaeon ex4484_52]